jgi:hypothetical protein
MQEERLPKLIMEWIPGERRKRGLPRKTWMEGVRAAMKTRHLRGLLEKYPTVFFYANT